jgi:peroxidase
MLNESASAEILISTPALQQTFTPNHYTFNEDWTPLALAIQQGRDHGIPSYHKALNLCEARLGLRKGEEIKFRDMESVGITEERRLLLENLYL